MKKSIFVLSGVLFFLLLTGCQQKSAQSRELDGFAECLSEKGAKMYGTEWCSHCKDQKAMFGASFAKINYIDCDLKRVQCSVAGIKGYPTWVFADSSKASGAQPLEVLAEKTRCELLKGIN